MDPDCQVFHLFSWILWWSVLALVGVSGFRLSAVSQRIYQLCKSSEDARNFLKSPQDQSSLYLLKMFSGTGLPASVDSLKQQERACRRWIEMQNTEEWSPALKNKSTVENDHFSLFVPRCKILLVNAEFCNHWIISG